MFVPAGWPHAVMNLDMTLAVTQNYVSTATFADAWRHTKASRELPQLVPSRCRGGHALPWRGLRSLHSVRPPSGITSTPPVRVFVPQRGRPKMSAKWLAALQEQRPDLAAIAGVQARLFFRPLRLCAWGAAHALPPPLHRLNWLTGRCRAALPVHCTTCRPAGCAGQRRVGQQLQQLLILL